MKALGLLAALLLAAGPSAQTALRGDKAPDWLRHAIASAPKERRDGGLVLLDEEQVVIDSSGRARISRRSAVQAQSFMNRWEVSWSFPYERSQEDVRDFRAWIVSPSGEVKSYARTNDLGRESWRSWIHATALRFVGQDEPGYVLAYEVELEERPAFSSREWSFTSEYFPVSVSRFVLSLPQGWRAEGKLFHTAELAPTIAGATYRWELRDLARRVNEIAGPAPAKSSPWLGVSWFPPRPDPHARTFADWTELSQWYSAIVDPLLAPDAAVSAEAKELTRESHTDLERTRTLSRFVQALRGPDVNAIPRVYEPRAAARVLASGNGDAQDKSVLLCAMLRAVAIPAYMVLADAADPDAVHESWVSPTQFDHAMVAIAVRDVPDWPGVLEPAELGRVVLFDPDVNGTSLGTLPAAEEGGLVLVVAGNRSTLIRAPVSPPEANKVERETDLTVDAQGSGEAQVRERSIGAGAASERATLHKNGAPAYRKAIEDAVIKVSADARIQSLEWSAPPDDDPFHLELHFVAPSYGRLLQGRLLTFKPFALRPRPGCPNLREGPRRTPVVLRASAFSETLHVTLPAGFTIDELPSAVSLATPFAQYTTSVAREKEGLVLKRRYVTQRATIPADQYASVTSFFQKVDAADNASVVLRKD